MIPTLSKVKSQNTIAKLHIFTCPAPPHTFPASLRLTKTTKLSTMAEFVLTPQIKALALRSLGELRGETVFIVSAETSKPIKVNPNGSVTANGGLGPHARFRVRRGDRPHRLGPVVRFENVATGKFLAIKGGHLTVGGGGEHCEFIVQMAQMAVFLKKHNNPNARVGFNPNGQPVPANTLGDGSRGRFFIFDCDQVVQPRGPSAAQQQQRAAAAAQQRAQQQAQQATARAMAQQTQAEFVLTPQIKALALRSLRDLKGETVYIVSAETSKPIMMMPNGNVNANGGLNPMSLFRVLRGDRPHRLGPVVRFQNFATGQFLAIKNGQLTQGGGGEHCEFIVEMAQMAVFLKKHNNPNARIGFNPNGQPVPANTLGDGSRGRFFIFDAAQVQALPRALPQAHAVPAHQPHIPQAHAHQPHIPQAHAHHPHPHHPAPAQHPGHVRPHQRGVVRSCCVHMKLGPLVSRFSHRCLLFRL